MDNSDQNREAITVRATEVKEVRTESTQEEIDIVAKLGATLSTDAGPTFARYLWYGDYGEGKTYMIGILNEMLKERGTRGCFGMDFDGAMRNVLKSAEISMPVKTYLGDDAYNTFENDIAQFYTSNQGFGALIIDPLTAFERIIMKKVLRVNPISRHLKGKMNALPYGTMSIQDYGIAFEIILNILQFLQSVSLHMHVVMTAHIIERQNPVTTVTEFLPSISGKKMPSSIGRWFNEVWRIHSEMVKGDIGRYAQTASFDKFKCKSQVKGMPYDLPVVAALEKTLDAYASGDVMPMKRGKKEGMTHPEDLDEQTSLDEPLLEEEKEKEKEETAPA